MNIIDLGERCRKLGLTLLIRTHEDSEFPYLKWFIHIYRTNSIATQNGIDFYPNTIYKTYTSESELKEHEKKINKFLDEIETK